MSSLAQNLQRKRNSRDLLWARGKRIGKRCAEALAPRNQLLGRYRTNRKTEIFSAQCWFLGALRDAVRPVRLQHQKKEGKKTSLTEPTAYALALHVSHHTCCRPERKSLLHFCYITGLHEHVDGNVRPHQSIDRQHRNCYAFD